ncbi:MULTISPECIES: sugar ABC transporter substrate-binding protein [unclassified Paenibacillus]|uniref:sugar ABC transporter substrate-binding protein n=1 Tax=unclassified Paenibacillus TaxID=185978 RepID=UPI002F42835B
MKTRGKAKGLQLVVIALLIMSLMLAACGGKSTNNNPSSTPTKEGETAKDSNFNTEGFPIVKDKVKLKIAAFQTTSGKHFNDYGFFKKAEEVTNVQIDWDLNPGGSAWQEKKNLLFASSELPEAFYGHGILDEATDIVKYGSQGVLIPLEDLIEEYAPNLKALLEARPEIKQALTSPDGHIYSLPTMNDTYAVSKPALFINKKWLDELGLPLPKTTEDFYQALSAFKKKDPNKNNTADEIPFTFLSSDWNANLASFFGSFGLLDRRDHIIVNDDKVVYTAVQPEYKAAIEYFNKMFKEGLADPESFTQDKNLFTAKISQNNMIGAFMAWNYDSVGLPEDHDFVPLEPLAGPNGDQMWAGFQPGILFKGSFAITSANKNPEVTIRWIDYMFDPLVSIQAVHGMIGTNLIEQADGTFKVAQAPEGKTSAEFRESPETSRTVYAQTKEMQEKIINERQVKMPKTELDDLYGPYLVYNEFPKVYMTVEENSELTRYKTDIGTYVEKMYAQWMLNGGIETEWDGYVQQVNKMGLDRMIAIYQQAYDRYKTN